jgi:uncharacterized integral membrane protein
VDDGRPPEQSGGHGTNWKHWAIGTAVVLLFILVAQNAQSVELNFLFASVHTPLIFALLIAAGLGALVGWLTPRIRGSRDRKPDRDGD